MKTKHTITKIIEESKTGLKVVTDKSNISFWTKKKNVKNGKFYRGETELNDFWKDVNSRIGMDVCAPFIYKFPGHSFVAYDNGYVWSKTQKTVYKLKDYAGRSVDLPKATENIINFGREF